MASTSVIILPEQTNSSSQPVQPSKSASRLSTKFSELSAKGRKAFVAYITAGYPDPVSSIELLRGLAAAGVDVLEIGVPFSDPMADGPVIQHSSQVALEHGVTLSKTLEIISEASLDIPVVLFSYLNPVLAAGSDVLAKAKTAGVDGVLITDLPVGADVVREQWLGTGGLDFVRLVAPTTPAERMEEIGKHGGGFVYLISRLGVTGERESLPEDLPQTVNRLRQSTSLPICIGFGISTPSQAVAAASMGDGVVVGSALVRAAGQSLQDAISLAGSIRAALDAR